MEYKWYISPEEYLIAKKNGINKNVLNNRVRSYGWDIKRACTEPLHRQFLKSILNGKMLEKLNKNGITVDTFSKRIKAGWSMEKASNTPIMNKHDRAILAHRHRRRISDEQYKQAEDNGINRNALKRRVIQSRWEMEKAITTPIMSKRQCAEMGYRW